MTPSVLTRVVRHVFRNEKIPARVRWWFVAQGMCEWFDAMRAGLAAELGGIDKAGAAIARLSVRVFERRYAVLRESHASLPAITDDPRALPLLMGGLYRVASNPGACWVLEEIGGAPQSFIEHYRAEQLMAALTLEQRWEEVSTHLGEVLIALTEGLPSRGLTRARPLLGQICFDAGVHVGKKMKKAFALEATPDDALEVLRMSEYIFRVNPQHWGDTDAAAGTGYLEGTACPWYTAPGWNGAHCGIFGQFQSGISSVFGLRYQLTSTIPKHGGHTCRIDVRPIVRGDA